MRVEIEEIKFFESGTYNIHHRRPLTTGELTAESLRMLQEQSNYGNNLAPATLSRCATNILTVSRTPESMATIANGWATNRWRFFVKFVLIHDHGFASSTNSRDIVYATGYCDHSDISFSGLLDPNMMLYINSRINIRELTHNGSTSVSIVNNEQVLRGEASSGGFQSRRDYTIRPTDILAGVAIDIARQNSSELGFGDMGNVPVGITTSTFSNGFQNSNRANNSSSAYLSRVLTATQHGFDDSQNMDAMAMMLNNSSSLAEETHKSNDALFGQLIKTTNGHFANEGIILWGDLCRLVPYAEDIAQVFKYGGAHAANPIPQAGDSELWSGSTEEQHLASIISAALPGILAANFIAFAGILITNRSGQPEVIFTIPPMSYIQNYDITVFLNKIIRDIQSEIVPILTANNNRLVHVDIICDVAAHTQIDIALNGDPAVTRFNSATFADSSFSPMITSDRQRFDQIVTDIQQICFNIAERPATVSHSGQFTSQVRPIITSTANAGVVSAPGNLSKFF